tara:strand:- start:639 stop:1079 length:441 start_codon:yes stop_codon:yes gene_type:complete
LTLEKARFNHPDNPSIAAQLAIATLHEGHSPKAARLFQQAENLAETLSDSNRKLALGPTFQIEFATVLNLVGDLPGAEKRLRKAIRNMAPEQPGYTAMALRKLARLWIEQKRNMALAASLLNRAETLEPGNPETAELLQKIPRTSP